MLHVIVLGAAAGGGVPQWNCNCDACRSARMGGAAAWRSGQASVAFSGDDENWFLINASPDLRQQIAATPALHPRVGPGFGLRNSPIAGVILTNGEVDAVAGLLSLREGSPFVLYGHERVLATLDANSIFNVLDRSLVPRRRIEVDRPFFPTLPDGSPSGLEVVPFSVPGKPVLYLRAGGDTGEGDTIGLHVRTAANGAHFFFVAACGAVGPELRARVSGAPLLFFDGTLWRDDEMIRAGLGAKTGGEMGHIAMSGAAGSIEGLKGIGAARKIFVHVNNSNPALLTHSDERRALEDAGWQLAEDGWEIRL